MGKFQLITKGLIKENPTFVLLLGMCRAVAVLSDVCMPMPVPAICLPTMSVAALYLIHLKPSMKRRVKQMSGLFGIMLRRIILTGRWPLKMNFIPVLKPFRITAYTDATLRIVVSTMKFPFIPNGCW